MPSTKSILKKLTVDFPQFRFAKGDDFHWSPSDNTIFYADSPTGYSFLFHELSHALLGHSNYDKDIELITIERQAWDLAVSIAKQYNLEIDQETVESNLDSYRDWMHTRSICPDCSTIGVETSKNIYLCPACNNQWRVNEARLCALRRYRQK